MVRDLADHGFRIGLVADGRRAAFEKLLDQHDIRDCFETVTCSDVVGEEKPSPLMFRTALSSLGLAPQDAGRCVMVGNNLSRDVAGARRTGITAIHLAWTDRYPMEPATDEEVPDHTIDLPEQLLPLLLRIDGREGRPPAVQAAAVR